jgi:enoyl-CoA hydratase/carnithine racemase
MTFENRIHIEVDHGIARVRLDRPEKHNALDLKMFQAIEAAQKKLSADKGVRAVILHGAGVDFCSGLDIKALMNDRGGMRRLLWKWLPWRSNLAQVVSTGWRRLPAPVIAAVHGRCWGGGLQIALGADFRLVHPEASLSVMEGKWGLIPDMGGTLALRELTRRDQALWLAMSAEVMGAERAGELGLATAVAEDPLDAAADMADQLAQRSPDALAAVKRLYRKSWWSGPGAALARESIYQVRVIAGPNQRIAVKRQMGEEREFRSPRRW